MPCHEDLGGSGGMVHLFLISALDGNNELHATVALPLGKETLVQIRYECGWAPETVGRCGVKKNPLLLQGFESRLPSP